MKQYLPSIGTVFLLCICWEVGARIVDAMYILPSPSAIVLKIWGLRTILFQVHLIATFQVVVIGLVISLALGMLTASLMAMYPIVERVFYPLLIASQTIPITALAPLFVLWFGYSIWSKVVVTVLIAFFPIAVNTYDGFRAVQTDWKELLTTFGASRRHLFIKLYIPSALPYLFSGLKVAAPLSVIGAAIGEWLGAEAGLGYFSKRMMTQLDGAGVFAPIVLLSVLAVGMVVCIAIIEKKFVSWGKHS
ncbi:ABC transporter permease [Ectobacillus sp. JY-23]|uniref:ABC transporter permease n=1 Tax=Ectobacillus sp. JY-23 TaxID=2933872 RepID=UPI001FF66589|nr:ABC transporter permease [Ectobacillus sp. JY-23]UOY91974.1 ABC transporter permease [Ectobacillus sp. JY-23]